MTATDAKALSRLLAGAPSNWARWGAHDEVGALNYLTADEVKAVKTGGNFEVEVHKDIPYVEGKDADERQKLDLYVPKGHKDYPVLFFIHGGG